MLPLRKHFNRHNEFVAVQRIPLGNGNYIEAGTEVKLLDYAVHRMQIFYRRGQIGVKGSAWAERALARYASRVSTGAEVETETSAQVETETTSTPEVIEVETETPTPVETETTAESTESSSEKKRGKRRSKK